MPRLTCWFIRAALAHLGVGVVLGGLILSAKGFPGALGWAWLMLPAHIQLVVVGWMIQFALGMAYWILPRLDARGSRGSPGWAWASFASLNLGAAGSAALLVARTLRAAAWIDVLLIGTALLQAIAIAAFVWQAWRRVRPTALPAPPVRAERPR